MPNDSNLLSTIPVGPLGIIAMQSCTTLGQRVNSYLSRWRFARNNAEKSTIAFNGYEKESYLVSASCPRFGSGEAKGQLLESVRGKDLYILVDVTNYSIEYSLYGRACPMSPDDHYADIKRIIAACGGKARKITVIMPFLYESRQHKRSSRESLDCALCLQELVNLGVDNIITFDAHDPRVQNAIPLHGFENIRPTYQFLKALLMSTHDLELDKEHLMVISPDEGAMNRAIYFANILGVDMGMFYKRRDYSTVVDGRNPIVAHEFLGDSVEGKDVIIIDDMIASGESMIDVAKQLKQRKARRVFCVCTFGLFTNGLAPFDEATANGTIEKVITTNLTYQSPDLLSRDWYISADMSKYIALLIDHLNHDASISEILDPFDRIRDRIDEYRVSHTIRENY
ncbi:MAG: ribose-phosphate pyrophosphokinase [Bacteroidales bacterium]|nr:ribose-phosphate pyrophosphokinase [Clostridium sp.]MCM1203658.1 ribose-phosphate pyrophosphokinase [Bacteroidales bacterium]